MLHEAFSKTSSKRLQNIILLLPELCVSRFTLSRLRCRVQEKRVDLLNDLEDFHNKLGCPFRKERQCHHEFK